MSHRANIAWLASMLATSDLRLGDRTVIVAPLFHIAGPRPGHVATVYARHDHRAGARRSSPGLMWDVIESRTHHGPFRVPAMLAIMYQHPKRAEVARPDLRWVLCGAAPVPVSLIEAYLGMGIEVLQVYGLTETHGGICLISAEHARTRWARRGSPTTASTCA
jgi:acyl-CoA synthetase (AMP-forming)/AMP-acid ligase II